MDLFTRLVVADYTMPKDRIFARMNLDDEEFRLYDRLYHLLTVRLPKPDLVIYLEASVETCLRRIRMRGREFERNIDPDYLRAAEGGVQRVLLPLLRDAAAGREHRRDRLRQQGGGLREPGRTDRPHPTEGRRCTYRSDPARARGPRRATRKPSPPRTGSRRRSRGRRDGDRAPSGSVGPEGPMEKKTGHRAPGTGVRKPGRSRSDAAAQAVTAPELRAAKGTRRLVMVTAVDEPSARLADRAGVDIVLVGDSLAMAALGRPDTLSVTLDEMIHHTRAAAAGARRALLVADMPFGSYQASVRRRGAQRLPSGRGGRRARGQAGRAARGRDRRDRRRRHPRHRPPRPHPAVGAPPRRVSRAGA